MTRIHRPAVLIAVLALAVAACNGDAAPETTTTTAPPDTSSSTTSTTAVPVTTTSTTTTLPSGPAIAQEGDENETVEAIQFILDCAGYGDLTVDGNFGPATRAAVEAAQEALGRAVTGAIDDETFAELSRACATPREFSAEDAPLEVVGNAAPADPEIVEVTGLAKSVITVSIAPPGVVVTVSAADGTVVPPAEDDDTTWEVPEAGDYRILVEPDLEPTTFVMEVDVLEGAELAGEWILGTDRLTYGDVVLEIGDDADTVIDHVFDILGHGVRGAYEEFDTDWYEISDPQSLGLRGIFIEGMAFLFYGPHAGDPDRPETLARIRFEGPSDDAEGNPRPDNYVTTAEGITVGDTLADLKAAYGSDVAAGSNSEEHYYRYTDSNGELCFYFGGSEPTDSSEIIEIATECRT